MTLLPPIVVGTLPLYNSPNCNRIYFAQSDLAQSNLAQSALAQIAFIFTFARLQDFARNLPLVNHLCTIGSWPSGNLLLVNYLHTIGFWPAGDSLLVNYFHTIGSWPPGNSLLVKHCCRTLLAIHFWPNIIAGIYPRPTFGQSVINQSVSDWSAICLSTSCTLNFVLSYWASLLNQLVKYYWVDNFTILKAPNPTGQPACLEKLNLTIPNSNLQKWHKAHALEKTFH